jgi:molecular chaperone HscB
VFELNMQLEELRMNKKMVEDDPALSQDVRNAKEHLVAEQNEMLGELQSSWRGWDALVDRSAAGETVTESERASACDAMLNILNRRKYLRNLLREIDEVLES